MAFAVHSKSSDRLAFFLQDADYVDRGATAQRHQYGFHRTWAVLVNRIRIEHDGIAVLGDTLKHLALFPLAMCDQEFGPPSNLISLSGIRARKLLRSWA